MPQPQLPGRTDLAALTAKEFDVLVVGGGVTGAACARDAALRGLDVLLLERHDFASGTSSRSSKLIHGGVRYLETYQFKLVAESLRERELSLKLAPHLTRVEPFLYLVYDGDDYGLGMLNFALTFYDIASGEFRARRHHMLNAQQVLAREPGLNPRGLRGGGLYFDVLTDDARLTLDLVKGAAEQGANVVNHIQVTGLIRVGQRVAGVRAQDLLTNQPYDFHARTVVNSTGPWVGQLVAEEYGAPAAKLKPSKGVHLVFDKKDFPLNTPVFLRSPDDGRVTWPTPALEEDRVYVGTTDTEYVGDIDRVEPDERDITYLLNVANHTLPDAHLDESHIIGSWAGLRPLIAPAPGTTVGKASREHKVERGPGGMVTISGGKLTSHRVMAQHVIDQVVKALGLPTGPYLADQVPLSGGAQPALVHARRALAALPAPRPLTNRWLRYYGANAVKILTLWEADPANRPEIGARGLTPAEIRYAVAAEYCQSLDDLMVRRTSLFFWDPDGGLQEIDAIADLLAELLGWTADRRASEIAAYIDLVARHRPGYNVPVGLAHYTARP
jgi:glycerol-3-phosphate dehydrogenase